MGEQVAWPTPPREPGPWGGGPPVAPPGNTPLPPLPGAGGVVHTGAASTNPWAAAGAPPVAAVPAAVPAVPRTGGPAPFPGLPRPTLVDRAPGWVLVGSALVVVALIVGAVYLVSNSGPSYPKHWDPRVEPIATWVEGARKLDYLHPVKVNFLTPEEYRKVATGSDGEDSPDAPADPAKAEPSQAAKDQAAELRALGFLSGDVDLDAAGDALSDSGTLAFYSPETKEVYVRGTDLTPGLRVTLAHELTHVLQDQHFDLNRVGKEENGDVLRALAEGDATRIEDQYKEEVLTDAERKVEAAQSKTEGKKAQDTLDQKVPAILETYFAAPYIFGPTMIDFLEKTGGSKAIDKAFEDVPTEEELFNPIIDGKPQADVQQLKVDPPAGTNALDDGTLGPTQLYLMLASRSSAAAALKAVDGWGGDAYVVAKEGGKVCVTADVTGDDAATSAALGDALAAWAAKSPNGSATATRNGDTTHLHACDPGPTAKAVGADVTTDYLAVPVTRTQVYTSVLDQGGTEEQGACFGNAIVQHFSVSQLNDQAYFETPGAQQEIATLRGRCK